MEQEEEEAEEEEEEEEEEEAEEEEEEEEENNKNKNNVCTGKRQERICALVRGQMDTRDLLINATPLFPVIHCTQQRQSEPS